MKQSKTYTLDTPAKVVAGKPSTQAKVGQTVTMQPVNKSSSKLSRGRKSVADTIAALTTAPPIIHEKPRFRWRVLLVLLLCYIGVGLISKYALLHNSLRLDESQSLWQSSHSFRGLLHVVAQDVHVPLYHIMLHFWQLYFGDGVSTARLLSMVFFVLNIPVFYLVMRQILRVNWALFATVLFSFSPFMNWYANEARMYTLLALMATLSQYFYLRILQRRGGWIGYSLSAIIGVYTHYFFMFNLAIQAFFYLTNRKRFAPGSFKKFVALGIFIVLELTPWLLYFHSLGSGKNESPNLVRPSSVDFFNALSQFGFGFQDNHINTILVSLWPILVVVALLAVKHKQRLSLQLNYILAAGFLPVILAFALSFLVTPFFISRYMISCIPPLTLIVVWFVSSYRRRLAVTVAAILVLVMGITSFNQIVSAQTPVKENYSRVANIIASEATPQDEIVLSTPFTIYPFEYYYHGTTEIQTLPNWNRRANNGIPQFDVKTMPSQIQSISKDHRYAYVVLSYDQGYETKIHSYYDQHYKLVSSTHLSHDLNLYVYKVGYNNSVPLSNLPAAQKYSAATAVGIDATTDKASLND